MDLQMRRRRFLRTIGGTMTAGVAASLAPGTPQRVLAAANRTAGSALSQGAGDESFWRDVQQQFSVDRAITYLNTSGASPSPRVVTDAVGRELRELENAPSRRLFVPLAGRMEPVRAELAKLFGCAADEVAITRNATDALNTVLLGIPLKPGDEVLTTTQDYWAMLDALEQRRRRDGIVVTKITLPIAPRGMDDLRQAFERGISPKTKLILVTHPLNLTGQLLPVKQICEIAHRRGIEVIVDGAQAVGQIGVKKADLDCDYFGASLHKWLMAPKETGMLYVKRDKIAKIWPLFPAPDSIKHDDIRRFEAFGTRSPVLLAIGEAVAYNNNLGAQRKEARLRFLTRHWVERLRLLPNVRFHTSFEPGMNAGGIATVEIAGISSAALTEYLWSRHQTVVFDVARRTKEFQGIRITPHLHTTVEELNRFCDAMETVARMGLPTA
jgi:selenocysteine lyase/cysteine desulfurase